jgi:hypothetical protein
VKKKKNPADSIRGSSGSKKIKVSGVRFQVSATISENSEVKTLLMEIPVKDLCLTL